MRNVDLNKIESSLVTVFLYSGILRLQCENLGLRIYNLLRRSFALYSSSGCVQILEKIITEVYFHVVGAWILNTRDRPMRFQ